MGADEDLMSVVKPAGGPLRSVEAVEGAVEGVGAGAGNGAAATADGAVAYTGYKTSLKRTATAMGAHESHTTGGGEGSCGHRPSAADRLAVKNHADKALELETPHRLS